MNFGKVKQKQRIATEKGIGRFGGNFAFPAAKRTVYRQPKDYYCGWEIGDVYALKISEEMQPLFDSKAQYLLIRTVDTAKCQPWQTVPIVYVKLSNGDALPKTLKNMTNVNTFKSGLRIMRIGFIP